MLRRAACGCAGTPICRLCVTGTAAVAAPVATTVATTVAAAALSGGPRRHLGSGTGEQLWAVVCHSTHRRVRVSAARAAPARVRPAAQVSSRRAAGQQWRRNPTGSKEVAANLCLMNPRATLQGHLERTQLLLRRLLKAYGRGRAGRGATSGAHARWREGRAARVRQPKAQALLLGKRVQLGGRRPRFYGASR